jgi:hypothetical protein
VSVRRDGFRVMECQTVFRPETVRIGCENGGKLRFGRFGGRNLFDEKFHLLPHAPANDDVIAVKPGGPPCAVKDLVPDVVLDQALQLLLAWRPVPRPRKSVAEVFDP